MLFVFFDTKMILQLLQSLQTCALLQEAGVIPPDQEHFGQNAS
jgi:hypothetical protein